MLRSHSPLYTPRAAAEEAPRAETVRLKEDAPRWSWREKRNLTITGALTLYALNLLLELPQGAMFGVFSNGMVYGPAVVIAGVLAYRKLGRPER
jgi:hypothetical protein